MLAKKYRLTKQNDFKRIFEGGQKGFGSLFCIRFFANNLDYCRVAVVVNNKVSKKAVERNILKRQVRAVIQSNFANFKQNSDIMINVLPRAVGKEYAELSEDLLKTLKKIKLL